jgi:hypothetical protein
MGRGPSGSRPLLIFVPAVLILAGVTRWWDRRGSHRSTPTPRRCRSCRHVGVLSS